MEEDDEPAEIEHTQNDEKRHVTVNDEPEVFTINPDTLEVERQVKPELLKEHSLEGFPDGMPSEKLLDIIQETAAIIKICEEKVIHQKLNNAKLGFILIRIAESIEQYEILMNHLIRFLVNGDEVTARYFIDICKRLPPYGDYLSVLYSIEDPTFVVEGIEGSVDKSDLLDFVGDIQNNTYNGGISLDSFRAMNNNIKKYMWERKQVSENFTRQLKKWLKLKNNVTEHLDELREKLYELSTYLDLLKSGDTKIRFIPETSFELKSFMTNEATSLNIEKSSFTPNVDSTRIASSGSTLKKSFTSPDNSSFRPNFYSTKASFRTIGAKNMSDKSGMFPENSIFRPNFHYTSIPASMTKGEFTSGKRKSPEKPSFRPNFHSTPVSLRPKGNSFMPEKSVKSPENFSFRPNGHSTSISSLSTWPTTEKSSMFNESCSFIPPFHSTLLPIRSTSVGRDESSFRPNIHSTPVSFRTTDDTFMTEENVISPKNRNFSPNFHSTSISSGHSDGVTHSINFGEGSSG